MMLIAARPLWHVRHRRCLAESVQWSRPSGVPRPNAGSCTAGAELAQASVMAALCAATAIIAVVLPSGLRWRCWAQCPWGARLPLPPAGADRRAVAAGMIAFLIAGMGGFMTVVNSAYVGA
ncbi:hypothetical protein I552_0414 [Mycobacterium xenopi 3993]|nr:hypothetical protein I552_0414 [Mycobacterium xenopi 3993]